MGRWWRAPAASALVAAAALVQVNGPSIGAGYGVVSYASLLAALALPPARALAVVAAGHLAALPLLLASRSMIPAVALMATVLRPLVAYASSRAARAWGPWAAAALWTALASLAATSAGILYYGDDAVHAALSVYDAAPAALAAATLAAWRRGGPWAAAVSAAGSLEYIVSVSFFPSAPAAAAGLLASLAAPLAPRWGRGAPLILAVLAAALAAGAAAGWGPLAASLSVYSYPLRPQSYGVGRWLLPAPCGGRVDALAGVHDPSRLRVVHGCIRVVGRVASPPFVAGDGDLCFDLDVSGANASPLLTLGSLVLRRGLLHVEVVPGNYSLLRGVGGVLCAGDVVEVVGVHVVDTDHGQWAEVHPVAALRLLRRGGGPCASPVERRG